MALEEAIDSVREGLPNGFPIPRGDLRFRGGVESLNQFCEPSLSTLTLGAKRLPNAAVRRLEPYP